MKKMMFFFFLMAILGIASFAQKRTPYLLNNSEKENNKIEKLCYELTRSYAEFKRCVENRGMLSCPKIRERAGSVYLDYFCRERDPYEIPGPIPADKIRPSHLSLPNEKLKSFGFL